MLPDARNPQGGPELSTSGHPDPSGLTGASLPTSHSPLNLTCFLTAPWTRALDAGSGDTVGAAPDLGGSGGRAGGEVGAGGGVIPGRTAGAVLAAARPPAGPFRPHPARPAPAPPTLYPWRKFPDPPPSTPTPRPLLGPARTHLGRPQRRPRRSG